MSINFDRALGVHPQALTLREKRSEILAANLANADTPDYKARDLDFKSVFQQSLADASGDLRRTHQGHMTGPNALLGAELLYRTPYQASLDGNTVETNIEQAKYAENAVQYQASLRFVSDDFAGLVRAIKGE
ncbi:flagellar basal body rod protein FlgB [Methylomonas sp. MED-D]|uniref:Flagellar basal body rod protein FlgB n=1 Tax=Methylomonas koyamae TaxID=702114 RepID=A0A177PH61_9GAMM|nr:MULTISPECIES: flagellar basal body rod protein FlgB [Methylomonas]NJA08373.1 flagellar basal body rod protein FlgB [Methylococcaceae bacterium WWC4]MDT4330234.1 flagellar basal body rod protein FlgB [Methylomonas sp. MV1]OAI29164.1 flagellar basal-body rod protein FlgB [Methylomonas koyamae]OHX38335.1 flagellar basal-body rod protein FlgB [Methylomonas sp. LWB]WGS86624.1 flagellar basal body rod protein FlgB [Methylomonas sp. UP202]